MNVTQYLLGFDKWNIGLNIDPYFHFPQSFSLTLPCLDLFSPQIWVQSKAPKSVHQKSQSITNHH